MPKRKPVEASEPAPVVAEPKKTARKAATTPKSTATKAAHKHHAKKTVEPVEVVAVESAIAPVAEPISFTASAPAVAHDTIAHLAYSYWESRGYQGGSSEEDWLRAERELTKFA